MTIGIRNLKQLYTDTVSYHRLQMCINYVCTVTSIHEVFDNEVVRNVCYYTCVYIRTYSVHKVWNYEPAIDICNELHACVYTSHTNHGAIHNV